MANPSAIDRYVIQQVRLRRLAGGWSQRRLAQALGVSSGFISRVEQGGRGARYSLERLSQIAGALGCTLHDLLPSAGWVDEEEVSITNYVDTTYHGDGPG